MISMVFTPDSVSVGASGAIFGFLGSLWAHLIEVRVPC